MTHWLLNSVVLAAGAYGRYEYTLATLNELKVFLAQPFESRVGYDQTAQLIKSWTGVSVPLNRSVSVLAPGDVAMVVRLLYRVDAAEKGRPVSERLDDWEIAVLKRLS